MAEINPRLVGINLLNKDHQELVFHSNQFRIGRCLGLELCLRDVNISRLHCIFSTGEAGWKVACKSSNGVRVNGNRLEKDTESSLKHGDTIRLSEQQIYYWKFCSVTENADLLIQPASKKMRSMISGQESISQHISEEARGGLEKRMASRRRAAEDRLMSVNTALEEAVTEGDKKQTALASQKELLLQRLAEQTNVAEKNLRYLREKAEKKLDEEKVDQETREGEMKKIKDVVRIKLEKEELEMKTQLEKIEKKIKLGEEKILRERKEKKVMFEKVAREKAKLETTMEKEKREMETQLNQLQERLEKENSCKERKEDEFKVMVDRMHNEQEDKLNKDNEKWIEMEKVIAHEKQEKERLAKEVEELKERFDVERIKQADEIKQEWLRWEADLELERATHTAQMKTFKEEKEKKEAEHHVENDAIARKTRLEILDQVENTVEAQFMCPTCMELFINPVVLNCGHTYCWLCLSQWKKAKGVPTCPQCRTVIKHENKALIVENMIDATMASLGQYRVAERNQKVAERKVVEAEFERKEEASSAQKDRNPTYEPALGTPQPPNVDNTIQIETRPLFAGPPLSIQRESRPHNPSHAAAGNHHPDREDERNGRRHREDDRNGRRNREDERNGGRHREDERNGRRHKEDERNGVEKRRATCFEDFHFYAFKKRHPTVLATDALCQFLLPIILLNQTFPPSQNNRSFAVHVEEHQEDMILTVTINTSASWTRNGFEIVDKKHCSASMGQICMEETYSDLILISEEGTRYPAHRCILAARSYYFSKLLYGGLKETSENVVNISCSEEILKNVLQFLYSGNITLQSRKLDYLLALLEEVRLMCIDNLQAALEDLLIKEFISKNTLVSSDDIKSVIIIFNTAVEKDFLVIARAARESVEKHLDEILGSSVLLGSISAHGLKALISGNDLDIPEVEIFRGVDQWMKLCGVLCNTGDKSAILSEVRLNQLTPKQLTKEVCPSGLFSDTQIVAALKQQQDYNRNNSRKVILNQNICLSSMGAKVIKGEKAEKSASEDSAIDGKTSASDYDTRRGYTMRLIGQRLEVRLPSKQKINKIKIILYDRDAPIMKKNQCTSGSSYVQVHTAGSSYVQAVQRDYSYKIESSMDRVKWEVIADFSNFKGRSWQTIYFPDRRVKYIGIVGIREHLSPNIQYDETPRNYIHCVAIEAMLDTNTEDTDRVNSGMVKM